VRSSGMENRPFRMLSLRKTRAFHNQNPPQPATRRGVVDTTAPSRYTGGVIEAVVNDPGFFVSCTALRATEHVFIDKEQAGQCLKQRSK
jgi:hypothetical protein